tara:strand:+ start:805 stop:1122 length:318 start_codon:yes stop_codon:yes gene_type:complete
MTKENLNVSDSSVIAIPLRNLVSLVGGAMILVYGYFGITERLNFLEHELELQDKDIILNSEFRIKWPRGEMGSLPDDARQDMMIDYLQDEVKILKELMNEEKQTD